MNNVKFRHFQFSHEKKKDYPRQTLDMTVAGRVDGDEVLIGVAVCSRKDCFSKDAGRKHAFERLTYNPTYRFPKQYKEDDFAIKEWFNALMMIAYKDGRGIKYRVTEIQKEFDTTEVGIKLQMNKNEAEAKFIKAKKAKVAAWRKKYPKE